MIGMEQPEDTPMTPEQEAEALKAINDHFFGSPEQRPDPLAVERGEDLEFLGEGAVPAVLPDPDGDEL